MDLEANIRPIRRCEVVGNDATSTAHQSVFCPRLEQSLPVSECFRCGLGQGIHDDSAADRRVMHCAWEGPKAPVHVAVGAQISDRSVSVRPTLDLSSLRALLLREGITGVPVVDEDGRAMGVVSRSDLVGRRDGTAADLMTTPVLALSERASLFQAAALMAYEGVHRVVVVDDQRRVVGVLSALDVAAWVAREHGYVIPPAPWATKVHRGASRREAGF
jgi:CBS domain-containing protein